MKHIWPLPATRHHCNIALRVFAQVVEMDHFKLTTPEEVLNNNIYRRFGLILTELFSIKYCYILQFRKLT